MSAPTVSAICTLVIDGLARQPGDPREAFDPSRFLAREIMRISERAVSPAGHSGGGLFGNRGQRTDDLRQGWVESAVAVDIDKHRVRQSVR